MASDASTGDGRRAESMRDTVPAKRVSDAPARTTADLTHELAQLLAATIAQRQLASNLPSTMQGLNLAALSPNQRMLEPTFKDGLSALSYKAPRNTSLVPAVELSPDDEPMPIPSTWREPPSSDGDRWLRQQMGATLLGLGAGLLVVIPVVLWLSGWLGAAQKSRPVRTAEAAIAPIEPRSSEVKTVRVQVRPVEPVGQTAAQYVTGSIDPRVAVEPSRTVEQPPKAPERAERTEPVPRIEERLAEAKHRIENGDVSGARDVLSAAEGSAPGPISFALAETYDPNMLAAWGTRGAIADVARAKALYHKSLDFGMVRAQVRLDALQ
jgi:hypothetical protein